MAFYVGEAYAGYVVIVSEDGPRFDLTPKQATDLADDIDRQLKHGADIVFVTAQAMQGRAFRYVGNPDSARDLMADLRRAAATGPTEPPNNKDD